MIVKSFLSLILTWEKNTRRNEVSVLSNNPNNLNKNLIGTIESVASELNMVKSFGKGGLVPGDKP